MNLDWLYGPRAVQVGPNAWLFGSVTINASDVEDIQVAIKEACGNVRTVRTETGSMVRHHNGPPIDVDSASDTDLRAVAIYGDAAGDHWTRSMVLYIGRETDAALYLNGDWTEDVQPTVQRIVGIISSGRGRRVSTAMSVQAGSRVVAAVLLAAWLITTIAGWPRVDLSVLGGAAALAFWWALAGKLRDWKNARHPIPYQGQVSIDTTPRGQIKIARANSRRDARIASISVASTLAAAVLTAWLTGLFDQGSGG